MLISFILTQKIELNFLFEAVQFCQTEYIAFPAAALMESLSTWKLEMPNCDEYVCMCVSVRRSVCVACACFQWKNMQYQISGVVSGRNY